MNPAKCNEYDYIQFLIAAQRVFSTVEASRTAPEEDVAHDAYTRLLHRLPPDSEALWDEVNPYVVPASGKLVIDDTTLDKPYASKMELVTQHWSGKHGGVVQGINLISLLWTNRAHCRLPCDYRIYNKAKDGKSKNDHFAAMLATAHTRDFDPELVCFDSWYSSLENLKQVRAYDWEWLTRLKSNRLVSLHPGQQQPISEVDIPYHGCQVYLKGYGWIKVFRTVAKNGDAEFCATSQLDMTVEECAFHALDAWQIEVYHRGLKQFTGIERAQFRRETAQRNHIGLAIRAFLRLEVHRIQQATSWFDAKASIVRQAIRLYLDSPRFILNSTA